MQENVVFIHEFSLPRFGTPLTNPGYTTVTGIAKGTRPHAPAPLIGVKYFLKEGGSRELVYVTSHNQPPNNAIQCARNVVFITFHTRIFKKSPYRTWEGGIYTLPRSVASLPRFGPPLTNPGCTTVTGIAKRHKGPFSPLIGVKLFF